MPERVQPVVPRPERSAAERAADHAEIVRLSDELLPALIAKLGATGLGELEVREDAWRVRLRRPRDGASAAGSRERRPGDRERAARAVPGPGGSHGHSGLTPVGPGLGREIHDGLPERESLDGRDTRIIATSPAVGIFQPRPESRAGTKVRAGDRIGTVDMLGIAQEVVAPSDGVVGATFVEAGDAVEYGQDLILIEFASAMHSET